MPTCLLLARNCLLQHSNADAIVVLDAGNTSGKKIRQEKWTPRSLSLAEKNVPQRIHFELDDSLREAILLAEEKFQKRVSIPSLAILFRETKLV